MTGFETAAGAATIMGSAGLGMPLIGGAGQFNIGAIDGFDATDYCLNRAKHKGEAAFNAETTVTRTFSLYRHGRLFGAIVKKIEVPLELYYEHGGYKHTVNGRERNVRDANGDRQFGVRNLSVRLNGKVFNKLNEGGGLLFSVQMRQPTNPVVEIQWRCALTGRGVMSQGHGERVGYICIEVATNTVFLRSGDKYSRKYLRFDDPAPEIR